MLGNPYNNTHIRIYYMFIWRQCFNHFMGIQWDASTDTTWDTANNTIWVCLKLRPVYPPNGQQMKGDFGVPHIFRQTRPMWVPIIIKTHFFPGRYWLKPYWKIWFIHRMKGYPKFQPPTGSNSWYAAKIVFIWCWKLGVGTLIRSNYNNSLTWNKAIWGWFPLLIMIDRTLMVNQYPKFRPFAPWFRWR